MRGVVKMQKYNNGHPIDVSKMPINDYELAAKEWAEGSKSLEELLLYCLKNNIVTQACCIGHKTEDKAFLLYHREDLYKHHHRFQMYMNHQVQ